jgi:hypothetical protein
VAFRESAAAADAAPPAQSLVPSSAIRRDGERSVVFVLQGDRLERRAVTVGRPLGSDVEILAGVATGEQVVVGGDVILADGQRVRVAG